MTNSSSAVDGRHPAEVVTAMVEHVLGLAESWPNWDGTPVSIAMEDEPPRVYTPHKAIRRVTDHLIDHLAEIEARLAGMPTEPDAWHASAVTTEADLALFSSIDLDEARSRLRRLGQVWDVRLRALSDDQLDALADGARTLRQVAFHVAESGFYADSVGKIPRA